MRERGGTHDGSQRRPQAAEADVEAQSAHVEEARKSTVVGIVGIIVNVGDSFQRDGGDDDDENVIAGTGAVDDRSRPHHGRGGAISIGASLGVDADNDDAAASSVSHGVARIPRGRLFFVGRTGVVGDRRFRK